MARDRDTDALLEARGWSVVRVWEHDRIPEAAERVVEAVAAGHRGRGCSQSATRRLLTVGKRAGIVCWRHSEHLFE